MAQSHHVSEFSGRQRDGAGRLVVTKHADVVAAATNPALFSNAVSRFRQIPNGLDGQEHARYRELLDQFFSADQIQALEPALRELATRIIAEFPAGQFDAVADLGIKFAIGGSVAWLGWPSDLEPELTAWVSDHREAIIAGDLAASALVAERFDSMMAGLIRQRQGRPASDVTGELIGARTGEVGPLTEADVISVLRNWTGGDLSSVARCVGVVVAWLAEHSEHQRFLTRATDAVLDAAIDEILRLNDPFVSNRRTATADTQLAGCPINAGDQIVLSWREANLDPAAFTDPNTFDPARNRDKNLVYGTGVHVCPGRGLATLQLRVIVQTLLTAGRVEFDTTKPIQAESEPFAGYWSVPVRLVKIPG